MYNIHILLYTFWFISISKYVLFWLYLWQLKEYHVGRFVDHFRTHKGRRLLLNPLQFLKIIAVVALFINDSLFVYLFLIISFIYLSETILASRSILKKSIKEPVKTFKSLFLTGFSFATALFFFIWTFGLNFRYQLLSLLIFDILMPVFISVVVLLFQPISVLMRNNILKKADHKLGEMRAISGLKVIAITGSYGKTSTKEFLSTILSNKFKVSSTKNHQNSEIGIAKCILEELESHHQIFIAEVGAYDKGKVKEVCSILKPQMGIVTGVNDQHIALFGSMENLLSAEGGGELADSLSKDGTLFLNGDNKHCLNLYKKIEDSGLNRKIYSLSDKVINSDIWSDSVSVHRDFISFLAIDKSGEMMHFDVKVLGEQNVQNLLGAILIAKELGMNFGEISEACKKIFQEQAGMALKKGKHGIDVIDSSYSSNPDGVVADLKYLLTFPNKKIIIMPCLIELGNKSSEIHKKIGRGIGMVCDLAIITSKDHFVDIKKGAMEGGMAEKNILLCDKAQDIYSIITLFCKAGDAVLLEGRVPSELIRFLQ